MEIKESNGALLAEGDSVKVIKDLKVKGSSSTIKRGTVLKIFDLLQIMRKLMVVRTELL